MVAVGNSCIRNYKLDWGKADDCNCNYGHPKIVDMKLGENLFCRLNCFYDVFEMTHALVG